VPGVFDEAVGDVVQLLLFLGASNAISLLRQPLFAVGDVAHKTALQACRTLLWSPIGDDLCHPVCIALPTAALAFLSGAGVFRRVL
jgi:hypothetical protein